MSESTAQAVCFNTKAMLFVNEQALRGRVTVTGDVIILGSDVTVGSWLTSRVS